VALDVVSSNFFGVLNNSEIFIRVFIGLTPNLTKPNT